MSNTSTNLVQFHKHRRMFCIMKEVLHVAQPNIPDSHIEWSQREGWTTSLRDPQYEKIVRGMVDHEGNVHFYVGSDFHIDQNAEKQFFNHIEDLANALHLNREVRIFGGKVVGEVGTLWKPIKTYGTIQDHISI